MKLLFFLSLFVFSVRSISAQYLTNIGPYIAASRNFKEYFYDSTAVSPAQFGYLEPDITLIPSSNGVLIAGLNAWLWKVDSFMVTGIFPCLEDNKTYAVFSDSSGSSIFSIEKIHSKPVFEFIHNLGKGWFTMQGYSADEIYIWGVIDSLEAYFLWHFDGTDLSLLYEGPDPISDIGWLSIGKIAAVSPSGVLYFLEKGKEPLVVLKTDLFFDGIEVAKDGSVFLSSQMGVTRHYDLFDLKDIDPISFYIHGTLQLIHDRLYINCRENHEIVRIDIFSKK